MTICYEIHKIHLHILNEIQPLILSSLAKLGYTHQAPRPTNSHIGFSLAAATPQQLSYERQA